MKKGDKVFLYLDKSRSSSKIEKKLGGVSYDRTRGTILKMYGAKRQLSAIDIEKFFAVQPGSSAFSKIYASSPNQKRAVMETKDGEHHLLMENMWEDNGPGDFGYVEIIPNSVDFLLGDD